MTRQSLDSPADRSGEWTRIGRGGLKGTALFVLVLSAVVALFITAPMGQFGPVLFGVEIPVVLAYIASVIVVVLMFAPVMLPRATRPLFVNTSATRIRVGLRSMPVTELHHAYRLPDPQFDGRFQLRLAVRGLDALVGISASPPAELSVAELDSLIAVIEAAPIEPDPEVMLHPPIGDELGERSAAEQFSDDLSRVLQPFDQTTFAKATLLRELRIVRNTLVGGGTGEGTAFIRDIGLVAPGTSNAPVRLTALAAEAMRDRGPKRGFLAMQGSAYRSALRETEAWIATASSGSFAARLGWQWPVGLLVVIAGLLSPWIAVLVIVLSILVFFNPDIAAVGGPVPFFVLIWPFIVWAGLMLMWHGRISRFQRARAAALEVRRGGVDVPPTVAGFFGAPFPEVAYVNPNIVHLVSQFIVLLAGGLTAVAVSNATAGLSGGLPVGIPVGILMVLSSAVVFTVLVRTMGTAPLRQLRARAIWTALSSRVG